MALGSLVKTLQNIMRKDAGINGDAQRIEQMTWLFFLKIYDAKEQEWEFHDDSYQSIIPERLRWHSWAHDAKDGKALTGDELLDFETMIYSRLLRVLSLHLMRLCDTSSSRLLLLTPTTT